MSDKPPKIKRGTARYRQQRRKDRQQTLTQKRERRRSNQLIPEGGFKLPAIPFVNKQTLYIGYSVIAVLLIIGMVLVLRYINPPEATTPPNGIWLGTGWTYDRPQEAAVADLVRTLRGSQIGITYAWVSYLRSDATWSGKRADVDPQTNESVSTINPDTGDSIYQYPRRNGREYSLFCPDL